jgi:hypothetical protein
VGRLTTRSDRVDKAVCHDWLWTVMVALGDELRSRVTGGTPAKQLQTGNDQTGYREGREVIDREWRFRIYLSIGNESRRATWINMSCSFSFT